ncbi:MAG: InlB B-repeat-containing protein [Thermoclostridium sp.]|nr:InlB B-repeat-containing protein [Thermoclostridium sp.]
MSRIKKMHRILIIMIIFTAALPFTSCSRLGNAIDPSDWYYDCVITYDALGGTINSRPLRETYYMKNSYLFEPSGTTNLLIEPVKDGHLLSGWYTAKEDVLDKDGNIIGYSFKSEDRWDFDEDRVQESITLYARWIPQGKVEYIDASTGNVMFSKNITQSSPVQRLSAAAENLIAKEGFTLYNYFADEACTIPYVFTDYIHSELVPTNEEIYTQLASEFASYFRKVEYIEPEENIDELEKDTSDLYINRLGFEITTDDEQARNQIRKRKDEIIESAITNYETNTSDKKVYLKYLEGSYIRAANADDLKNGGAFGFTGFDSFGNPVDGYILQNDIDCTGTTVQMVDSFNGKIYGSGFSLKNIQMNISSRKVDMDTSKTVGLFNSLDGAYIEDVNFENLSINLNVKAGIPVTVGALAIRANNTTLKNVTFNGLKINTGRGDDGAAKYKISDLFVSGSNNQLENVNGVNVEIFASENAEVNSIFLP